MDHSSQLLKGVLDMVLLALIAEEPSYGQAAGRLEEILAKIEEGRVDIDELSRTMQRAYQKVKSKRGPDNADRTKENE